LNGEKRASTGQLRLDLEAMRDEGTRGEAATRIQAIAPGSADRRKTGQGGKDSEPGVTKAQSSSGFARVPDAAQKLWERKPHLWGLCKLLLALTPASDQARILRLKAVQESAGPADEPVSNFLEAIQDFNVDMLNDASLIIEQNEMNSQALSNLCASLYKCPSRLQHLKNMFHESDGNHQQSSGRAASASDSVPLPPVADRRSFGRDVVAKLPPPDHSLTSSRPNSDMTILTPVQPSPSGTTGHHGDGALESYDGRPVSYFFSSLDSLLLTDLLSLPSSSALATLFVLLSCFDLTLLSGMKPSTGLADKGRGSPAFSVASGEMTGIGMRSVLCSKHVLSTIHPFLSLPAKAFLERSC